MIIRKQQLLGQLTQTEDRVVKEELDQLIVFLFHFLEPVLEQTGRSIKISGKRLVGFLAFLKMLRNYVTH